METIPIRFAQLPNPINVGISKMSVRLDQDIIDKLNSFGQGHVKARVLCILYKAAYGSWKASVNVGSPEAENKLQELLDVEMRCRGFLQCELVDSQMLH